MNNICRICLKGGLLSSVFMKNYNVSLCDMIEYCSNIKIEENDGLPEQICSNCVYKLGIAYHFKHSCESSDIQLRQYHGLQKSSRYSDVAIMTDPVPPTYSTIIKKCNCKIGHKKTTSNYKRKSESEKKKRGPKPKPKQIHSCYQCQKEFRCQAQLEMHVRTHTGEQPYACLYCPRRFTQKHNLTIHLRTHTGEKPFQCEVCSKTFCAQSNLQTHLKIHTGQKDHVCSLCNKSFITSSELTRHMSKHSGVKKFKCNLCAAAYIHNRDLKLHKLRKHQVTLQSSKKQSESYNNGHIDIIGLDEGKDISQKEAGAFSSHTSEVKNAQSNSLLELEKEIFHPFPTKIVNSYNCAVCGEGFTFMTALVQHCLHHHKGYNPAQPKYYV